MPFNVQKAKQAGYTDQEIQAYIQQKSVNQPATQPSVKTEQPQQTPRSMTGALPVAGDVLGGFLGPVGAGAGYSIGNSLQRIIQELGGMGKSAKKSPELTPFAQQRLKEEEMAKPKRESVLPDLLANLAGDPNSDSRIVDAGEFAIKNLAGSAGAGVTDYVFGKAFDFLGKKVGGPLYNKVRGIKASTIEKTATESADDIWKPIQKTFDDAAKSGKTIDITDIVTDLEKQKELLTKGIDPSKLSPDNRLYSKIEGYDTVIKDLKEAANRSLEYTGPEKMFQMNYGVSPQGVQTLKSVLGQESFSPKTGFERMFSGLFERGEQQARKTAGGALRTKVINFLEESGVKDAAKQYDTWAKLNKIANLSSKGQQELITENIFFPSVVGGPISATGLATLGPSSLAFPLLYGATTPYGKQLSREGLRGLIGGLKVGERGVVSSLLNQLINGEQK